MTGEKTRLCIVSPTHWKAFMGGAQYQIKCILDALAPLERYQISYIAHRVAADFQPEDYRIVGLGNPARAPRFGYLMHARSLYRELKNIRPHVIYQRVGCGYTGIAAHYARRHGARLIWHVAHDSDVMPESLIDGRNPVRRHLEKRSIEYAIRHARHIVAQTEQQAALLQANYRRKVDLVLPNFHPEPREALDKSGPVTVVWVANLKPWKKPEAFVRLAGALRDLRDVRFVMIGALAAGPGERAWSDALLQDIAATPNLQYLGQRSQDEINQLLARAHLFVNTSLHEGFANTLIQAWAREVPVVALHVNPDGVLDREQVGVHAGTEERLSEAVRMLATDTEARSACARRSRAYALARHSIRNVGRLMDLIDDAALGPEQTAAAIDQSARHDQGSHGV